MPATLTPVDLNERFLDGLGVAARRVDPAEARPLALEADPPLPERLRVYIWNATNPPGGRSGNEHKIQLIVPGQSRGSIGNFDWSEDRAVVMAGYAEESDVFILWDATKHHDFGYSKNVQVHSDLIAAAVATGEVQQQERTLGSGEKEVVLVAQRTRLVEALARRFDVEPLPVPAAPLSLPVRARGRGRPYRRTTPATPAPATRVFEVDPDKLDRGTKAHAETQHALSDAATAAGHTPLSPLGADPQFDLAWINVDTAFVVEVKSLTTDNEERQLRLGLGQVLSYAYLLDWAGVTRVQPVLAAEREPNGAHWLGLCAQHGVRLVWPGTFTSLF